MKKDLFIIELIKSPPFKIFVILVLLVILGIIIANHREKAVQMKEDVLYIAPKPAE